MKTTDYEELLTDIENEYWNQNISVSDFYILFGHKIRTFREAQQKLISDPIEFAKKVCELSGCKYEDLRTRKRTRALVRARQLILVSGVKIFELTLEKAADIVGRDHSTYYFSHDAVRNDYETDRHYRKMFEEVFNEHPEILNFKP